MKWVISEELAGIVEKLNDISKCIENLINEEESSDVVIRWCWEDIQSLKPEWSREKCEDWIERNERHIQDRSIECGWEIIDTLLTIDEGEEDEETI